MPTSLRRADPSWYEDAAGEVGWRGGIALRGAETAVGPVSLEQVGPDERRTLHPLVDETMAAPMTAASGPPKGGAPSVSASVPVADGAEASDVTWRVHVGDWTGRWSDPVRTHRCAPAAADGPGLLAGGVVHPLVSAPERLGLDEMRVAIAFTPRAGQGGSVPVDRIKWDVDGSPEDPIVLTARRSRSTDSGCSATSWRRRQPWSVGEDSVHRRRSR